MVLESGDRIFKFTSERIRHVANAGCAVGQPLELVRRYARRRYHPHTAKSESIELTKRLDLEIGEGPSVLFGNMGDRQGEARRDGGEQHLRGSRSSVGAADLYRFIDEQLEVPDFDAASVLAIPGGGNGSHG